jgi:transcription initiation factor TFIIIB Brf1 subunit/transcription initiation factor TFIIB
LRRSALATYEEFSATGKCPECRGKLVDNGGFETTCASCGIVVAAGGTIGANQSPNGNISEPLGSYVAISDVGNDGTPEGFWGRRIPSPNVIGRNASVQKCTAIIERITERLLLPKSVARNAVILARRLLFVRESCHATLAAVAAYSVLYACRSAGVGRVGYKEILVACSDLGYRVKRSQLLRIGIDSSLPIPASNIEDLLESAVRNLQRNNDVAGRIHKRKLDERTFFVRLFEVSKELAAEHSETGGSSPRTVAASAVYLAGVKISPRTLTQGEAASALGIAEYTVREFCARARRQIEAR